MDMVEGKNLARYSGERGLDIYMENNNTVSNYKCLKLVHFETEL